jgi:hypothetical protein
VQYLRDHEQLNPEDITTGTIQNVWNIRFWTSFAYHFARLDVTEGGCIIWRGSVGYGVYPVVKVQQIVDYT